MNPGILMSVSASLFALLGVAALFLPAEVAAWAGVETAGDWSLQLFAAGLLAMALLNWTGRSAIYGGIYGRPIVMANFGFGLIAAGVFSSAVRSGILGSWGWLVVALFALHAGAFWMVSRTSPKAAADGVAT